MRFGTIHNVHFMQNLMREIREAIAQDRYEEYRAGFLAGYEISDQVVRHAQRQRRVEARRA